MRTALITLLALPALLFPLSQPLASPQGSHPAAAEKHGEHCAACHIRMYGGDGSKMYTRDGRQLSNKLELLQRVSACAANFNAGWFPEEEELVTNWLNTLYYRFNE